MISTHLLRHLLLNSPLFLVEAPQPIEQFSSILYTDHLSVNKHGVMCARHVQITVFMTETFTSVAGFSIDLCQTLYFPPTHKNTRLPHQTSMSCEYAVLLAKDGKGCGFHMNNINISHKNTCTNILFLTIIYIHMRAGMPGKPHPFAF